MRGGIGVGVLAPGYALDASGIGANNSAFWTPAAMGVLLLYWHCAANVHVVAAPDVDIAYDQSANARNLVQAVVAKQPHTGAARPNGLPALAFDGALHSLKVVDAAIVQPVHRFICMKWTSLLVATYAAEGGLNDRESYYDNVAGGLNCLLWCGAGLNYGAVTDATWHVYDDVANGANSRISIDGSALKTGNAGANNPGGCTIGSYADGTSCAQIDWSEDFAFSAPLDEAVRQMAVRYLRLSAGF